MTKCKTVSSSWTYIDISPQSVRKPDKQEQVSFSLSISLTHGFRIYLSIGSCEVPLIIYSCYIILLQRSVPLSRSHLLLISQASSNEFLNRPAEGDMMTLLQLEHNLQLFLCHVGGMIIGWWHKSITVSIKWLYNTPLLLLRVVGCRCLSDCCYISVWAGKTRLLQKDKLCLVFLK